jgi:hypothetical protein
MRRASILLVVVASCLLAGCEDDLARRDTIAPWAGDDIAANEAIQTVNPWPREAFDDRQVTQGSKVEDAMRIYRLPPALPSAAPETTSAVPAAAAPVVGAPGPGFN